MLKARKKGFVCHQCQKWIPITRLMGTHHRNHCPFCLYSLHVSLPCHGSMVPIGLTFKKEGKDKYGRVRQGELMVIHHCQTCQAVSINRLAADDDPTKVQALFDHSLKLEKEILDLLLTEGIVILQEKDRPEMMTQLYGKAI